MKKFLLAVLCTATIAGANAQKNSFLVYGNGAVSHSSADAAFANTNSTTWFINPGIGYQFSKHFTAGLQGGYNRQGYQWSLGPFVRYTQPLNKIFSVFGQIDLSYMSGERQYSVLVNPTTSRNIIDNFDGFSTAITPAVMVNVHKGWALNFGVGGVYFGTSSSRNYSNTNTDVVVTLGQQFNWGISKNINCRCRKNRGHAEPGSEYRRMPKYEKYDDDDSDDDKPKRGRVREHRKDEE
jgi:hypothetical protein